MGGLGWFGGGVSGMGWDGMNVPEWVAEMTCRFWRTEGGRMCSVVVVVVVVVAVPRTAVAASRLRRRAWMDRWDG